MKHEEVKRLLYEQGYEVFSLDGFGFDIVAKKRKDIFLKISDNINSVKAHVAQRLKRISWFFQAKPFIVGERRGSEQLLDSVVYHRYAVPAVTIRTLEYILNGEKITSFSERGGIFCEIDSSKVDVDMAQTTGVSRRCAYYYKSGEVDSIKYERSEKFRKLFGEDVFVNARFIDDRIEADIEGHDFLQRHFSGLGFRSVSVNEHIADVLAGTRSEQVMTKTGNAESTLQYHADRIKAACHALDLGPVFVITKSRMQRKVIKGIPVISLQELRNMKSKEEFLEAIKA